jgi:hypothetical protein
MAFQNLALAAGEMADATGLSTEQASRWITVAGDMGVSSDTLETAFGRLAKAVGQHSAALADLGLKIAHTKDGQVDMNQTMLNAITLLNTTKDEAQKAAIASQLFGKGWQSMSELIGQGSDKLTADLAKVDATRVISPEQVQQSREFRDSLKELEHSASDLGMTLGQELVPVLTTVTKDMNDALTSFKEWSARGALDLPNAPQGGFLSAFSGGQKEFAGAIDALVGAHDAAAKAVDADKKLAEAAAKVKQGFDDSGRAAAGFVSDLDPVAVASASYLKDTEASAKATADLQQALHDVAIKGFDPASTAAKSFGDSWSATNAKLTSDLALAKTNAALTALTDGWKKNGRAIDENTDKGRTNLANVANLSGAYSDQLQTMLAQGASYDDITKQAAAWSAQLQAQIPLTDKHGRAIKGNTDLFQQYLTELGLTPKQVETTIKLSKRQQAINELQIYKGVIDKLPTDEMLKIDALWVTDPVAAVNELHTAIATAEGQGKTTADIYGNPQPFITDLAGLQAYINQHPMVVPVKPRLVTGVPGGPNTGATPFALPPGASTVIVNVPPTLNPAAVVAAVTNGQARNGALRRG